jgi:hypothetical protein
MKNLLALVAIVLAFTVSTASAQTTTKKERKEKAKTEQTTSTETSVVAPSTGKACCSSHGAKTTSTATTGEVKTASTTHEHAGAMCDPKNCTEAQKKQCSGAKASGKGCCMGSSAAKTEEAPKP